MSCTVLLALPGCVPSPYITINTPEKKKHEGFRTSGKDG